MSKGRRPGERTGRLDALFDAGDHGAARRLAAEILADPAADAGQREAASALVAKIAPDRAVAAAGLAGAVAAVAIAAWLVAH